jgi:hypothetical protein
MSSAAKEILESALKLEPDERERLAEALWHSLGNPASVDVSPTSGRGRDNQLSRRLTRLPSALTNHPLGVGLAALASVVADSASEAAAVPAAAKSTGAMANADQTMMR